MSKLIGSVLSRIALVFVVVYPAVVLTETIAVTEPEAVEAPAKKLVRPKKKTNQAKDLTKQFYTALNHVYRDDFGKAADLLNVLKRDSLQKGYENLPDFSFELFNLARQALDDKQREKAIFFVRHAVELSSSDSRVNIIAASFYKLLGIGEAASFAVRSISLLPRSPLALSSVFLNTFLVGLLAVTLSFFILCVVQLLRSGELVLGRIAGMLPRRFRGVVPPFCFLALLVLPLFCGVLCALGAWGLVLASCKKSCRWLGALCGVTILCWALAIPVMSTVGYNVGLEETRVIEDINNSSFSPKGEEFIKRQLAKSPNDPLLLFALGQVYHRRNLLKQAEESYQLAAKSSKGGALSDAAKFNIGVVAQQDESFDKAKSIFVELEQRGNRSFELYFNLSLAELALLDMVAHRRYFQQARELDHQRVEAIERAELEYGIARAPLMVTMQSFSSYTPLIMRSIAASNSQQFLAAKKKEAVLAGSMLSGGSLEFTSGVTFLHLFGAIVLCLGLYVKNKPPYARLEREAPEKSYSRDAEERESAIWFFFPTGLYLAGDRPLWGAGLLACLVGLVVLAMGAPVALYGGLPVEVSFNNCWIGLAVLFLLLTSLSSLTFRGRKAKKEKR